MKLLNLVSNASNGMVQFSNCVFIMSDWAAYVNSSMNTDSAAFLTGTNVVVSEETVERVEISE